MTKGQGVVIMQSMPNPKEDGSLKPPIRIDSTSEVHNKGTDSEFKATFLSSPDTPFDMWIYEVGGKTPEYALHWPSRVSREKVIQIIKELGGTAEGEVLYSISSISELSEVEENAMSGEQSEDLESIYDENFTFLAVGLPSEHIAVIWQSKNYFFNPNPNDCFAIMTNIDHSPTGDFVKLLVKRTCSDEVKPGVDRVLEAFEQNMTNYLATSDYSNSPKPKV